MDNFNVIYPNWGRECICKIERLNGNYVYLADQRI